METPIKEGTREEHLELIAHHAGHMHRFVAQYVANEADAADIAQESLLAACEKLGTFRGENFQGWLFAIARNLIVDHCRVRRRYAFLEVDHAALSEAEPALSTRAEIVHTVCDCREQVRCWVDCIKRELRLEEQIAVVLADVHGYSDKEAAGIIGTSLPSFKLLLHCSRSRLRQISGGACKLLKRAGTFPGCPPATDGSGAGASCGCAKNRAAGDGSAGCEARKCCVGMESCVSRKCCSGVACNLGLKCCRNVPRLLALRDRLLECLAFS